MQRPLGCNGHLDATVTALFALAQNNACMRCSSEILRKDRYKLVCPLRSLLNEIQEWIAPVSPTRLGASPAGWRGSPMRAGWNNAAEVSVQTSERASSLPMLDMPG